MKGNEMKLNEMKDFNLINLYWENGDAQAY